MHPIINIAMAGTSRQERARFTTGTPLDDVIAGLPEDEVERSFLLSAGAWAIYRQAGMLAQNAEAHTPAAPETLRECSPEAALLLSRLLNGEQSALLPEALARMRQQSLRLPFHLLPLALNTTGKEARAAIFPLLGERGRWLSQFNYTWRWVSNYLVSDDSGLPADAETTWQEGSQGQRVEILRRLRAVDPGQARDWLEGVWKQEKAEARSEMIEALAIGLSADDEPFLENALEDRASGVRSTAASLLARLLNSALSERMRQRAQDFLQLVDGQIIVKVPTAFVQEWQRDGISEKPSGHISQRGWWLMQILSIVNPAFWESHLSASAADLLKLLPEDHEWKTQILEGWSKAAIHFQTQEWLVPLWSWWYEHYQDVSSKRSLSDYSYREQLLKLIPGPAAERLILDVIASKNGTLPDDWWQFLPELPKPWSVEFAQFYLQLMRERCTEEKLQADGFNPYADPLYREITDVALCLPRACFAEALEPWALPEENTSWQVQYVCGQMKTFTEIIHTRQKIDEEIV